MISARHIISVLVAALLCAAMLAQERGAFEGQPSQLQVKVDGVLEPIYKTGNGVTPPRILKQKPAEFTESARQNHITGTVVLTFVVTSKGDVTMIRVAKSLGGGLDEKAIEAVRTWKFSPARKEGKPVSTQVAAEVAFNL